MDQTVAVIGLGYIGLPTSVILARSGYRVIGVDINPRHVDAVNRGELPFVEDGLEAALVEAVTSGQLTAQVTTPPADIYIVAVPTPFAEGHACDMTYIDAAVDGIAPTLTGGELILLESTSPPGTTARMAERISQTRPELTDVLYAHCPERVLPGKIMEELLSNDRVIGGLTPAAAEAAKALYASFCEGELHLTDATTAELAKLTENSFRDVNIAFANELSLIADELGVDVWELISLANKHPRVNILRPGPGVGGHCIAVDPWFIVSSAPNSSHLIRTAREVNDGKPSWVLRRVETLLNGAASPTIACLGLAFKANIDDLRESPALHITADLAEQHPNAKILAVEPHIRELPKSLAGFDNVTLTAYEDALGAADVYVLLVDHRVFGTVRPDAVSAEQLVDTCGAWRAQQP